MLHLSNAPLILSFTSILLDRIMVYEPCLWELYINGHVHIILFTKPDIGIWFYDYVALF